TTTIHSPAAQRSLHWQAAIKRASRKKSDWKPTRTDSMPSKCSSLTISVISKLRANCDIVSDGGDYMRAIKPASGGLFAAWPWSYLKGCLPMCFAGLTLMQGSVLASDNAIYAVGQRGEPQYQQNVVSQAQPEDGATFPGGGYGQRPFGRQRWQGKAFPGGSEPGQVGELDTGVPGRYDRPVGPGGFEVPADGSEGGGFNGPGGPGGFYGRR